ncbi:MAG: cation:proton antiporter [Epsilonproteobacteria bacterium]|nr:cation:proton antiporter [Campylobacterota bacterium]
MDILCDNYLFCCSCEDSFTKTSTVDVLWLILFGSIGVNLGILPEHNAILEAIGEWGIVFVMFALGFDEDLNHFIQGLKRSFGIAVIGAVFPFLAGFYTAKLFGYDFNAQMIWGLTMTATAVSLTMVSLREEGLHKTTASTAIMSAAVVDDILSYWSCHYDPYRYQCHWRILSKYRVWRDCHDNTQGASLFWHYQFYRNGAFS